jgi:hypothetical protein
VWQVKDLREGFFGSVAVIGLTDEFSEVWQGKELAKRAKERDEVWQDSEAHPLPALFL